MRGVYRDRRDAGVVLAQQCQRYLRETGRDAANVVVIGLPRGGLPTADEVASALGAPLDIIVPRKIGLPGDEEVAAGALAEEGFCVWNEDLLRATGLSPEDLSDTIEKESREAKRRLRVYRGNRAALNLDGKVALICDDGLATGATMRAAIASAKKKGAREIVIAVPVAASDSLEAIRPLVAGVICPLSVDPRHGFFGVGSYYHHFGQTSDEEVIAIMEKRE